MEDEYPPPNARRAILECEDFPVEYERGESFSPYSEGDDGSAF